MVENPFTTPTAPPSGDMQLLVVAHHRVLAILCLRKSCPLRLCWVLPTASVAQAQRSLLCPHWHHHRYFVGFNMDGNPKPIQSSSSFPCLMAINWGPTPNVWKHINRFSSCVDTAVAELSGSYRSISEGGLTWFNHRGLHHRWGVHQQNF